MMQSKQIRPPIYSLKQSKLRKRRVVRFAILYFILLILFLALVVGPVVGGSKINLAPILKQLQLGAANKPIILVQPTGLFNNDTNSTLTGNFINDMTAGMVLGASGFVGTHTTRKN